MLSVFVTQIGSAAEFCRTGVGEESCYALSAHRPERPPGAHSARFAGHRLRLNALPGASLGSSVAATFFPAQGAGGAQRLRRPAPPHPFFLITPFAYQQPAQIRKACYEAGVCRNNLTHSQQDDTPSQAVQDWPGIPHPVTAWPVDPIPHLCHLVKGLSRHKIPGLLEAIQNKKAGKTPREFIPRFP